MGSPLRVPRSARPRWESVPAPERCRRVPRRIDRVARIMRTVGDAALGTAAVVLILMVVVAIRLAS